MDLQIKPEDGVAPLKRKEKKRRRERSPQMQGYIDAFAAFKPGQSFFVPGAKRADLEFLRAPFVDAGLGMLMREVECDQKHGVAGVRVWRQHGEYDHGVTEPASPASDHDPDLDDEL